MNASKNIRLTADTNLYEAHIFTKDADGLHTIPFFAAKELAAKNKSRLNVQLKAMSLCADFVRNPLILPELAFSNEKRTMRVEMRCDLAKVMQAMLYLTNFKIFTLGTPDLKKGFIPTSMHEIMQMTGLPKATFFRCISVLKKINFLVSDQRVTCKSGKQFKKRNAATNSGYAFTDKVVTGLVAALCRFDDNFNRQINKHLPEYLARRDQAAAVKANVSYTDYIKRAYAKFKVAIKNSFSTEKKTTAAPNNNNQPAPQQKPFAMPATINHDPFMLSIARALVSKAQRLAKVISEDQSIKLLSQAGNANWQRLLTDDDLLTRLLQ